jgi:predicted MFS family arabinose efflux permease
VAEGDTASALTAWLRPLANLARSHPLRALGVAAAGGLTALGSICVFQFTAYFAMTVHGWLPAQFSAMVILGGGIGIIGNVVAGRLGDRIGRRIVGFGLTTIFPLVAVIFYHGPGWSLPLAWIMLVFCATGGDLVIRALSTELFPTSQRGTSAGWLAMVQTLGSAAGLGLLGLGTNKSADIARMTSLLAFTVLLGGLCLLALPETHRRELEAISADR